MDAAVSPKKTSTFTSATLRLKRKLGLCGPCLMSFFTALVILAWNQLSLEHKTLSFSTRTGQEQAQLQSLRAARLPCKSRADRCMRQAVRF